MIFLIDKKRRLSFTDEEAETFRQKLLAARQEIHKEIVGLDHAIDALIIAILAGVSRRGHILFEAAPGRGKTLLVKAFSEVMDLKYTRLQGTPDHEPQDLHYDHKIADKGINEINFSRGPVFTNILLADELNRNTQKFQSALLEPMEEAVVTFEGQEVALGDFHLLATQNPIETEGTYGVSEALRDRFMFKIFVNFPSDRELAQIIARDQAPKKLSKILTLEEITKWSRLIYENYVLNLKPDSSIVDYIARIIQSAYNHPAKLGGIRGESPSVRPGEDMKIAAGINAFIEGRDKTSQHDVKKWALPALRGRYPVNKQEALRMGFQGRHINEITDLVIADIMNNTPFVT